MVSVQDSNAQTAFDRWIQSAQLKSACFWPEVYERCWHAALARLTTATNHNRTPKELPESLLASSDDEILDYFVRTRKANQLYVLRVNLIDRPHGADKLGNEDIATNFFYGAFSFEKFGNATRVIYDLPEAFIDYSYRGLHPPSRNNNYVYTPDELGLPSDELSDDLMMMRCATNYLLRNFWHNCVHVRLQNITSNNFHNFRGDARNESDFEADNLSLLLLAYSYKLKVQADRFRAGAHAPIVGIVHMLRQNRCNNLFALRAQARAEDVSLEDYEWRLRRSIAGYLSGWFLAQGLALASISVHVVGKIIGNGQRRHRVRPSLAINLNGFRLHYDEQIPKSAEERATYFSDMAIHLAGEYRKRLAQDKRFKDYAVRSLESVLIRFGMGH